MHSAHGPGGESSRSVDRLEVVLFGLAGAAFSVQPTYAILSPSARHPLLPCTKLGTAGAPVCLLPAAFIHLLIDPHRHRDGNNKLDYAALHDCLLSINKEANANLAP